MCTGVQKVPRNLFALGRPQKRAPRSFRAAGPGPNAALNVSHQHYAMALHPGTATLPDLEAVVRVTPGLSFALRARALQEISARPLLWRDSCGATAWALSENT